MTESFPGWTAEVQRSFKEVLFRFLEEVHCTKTALYLLAPDGSYGLMAQYGFGRRDHLPVEHQAQDVIALKARELRTKPWALNHSKEDPEFGEHLSSAGTNRMMLVPLYGASRVLGFVDARDKGGKRAFEAVDLQQGAIIVDELLDLARRHGLFPDLVADAAAPASPGPPALREPNRINDQAGEALLDEYGLQDLDEALMDTISHDAVFAITPVLPHEQLRVRDIELGEGALISLLGFDGEIEWREDGGDIILYLPDVPVRELPSGPAYVFKFTGVVSNDRFWTPNQ